MRAGSEAPGEGLGWASAGWVEPGVRTPISPAREAASEERRLVHPYSEDGARLKALLPVKSVPTLLS